MITLKPYRDIKAIEDDKGKSRVGGLLKTGQMAYAWHKHPSLVEKLITYALGGLGLSIVLGLLTRSPVWVGMFMLVCVIALVLINPVWQLYLKQYIGQPVMRVSSEHVARGDMLEIEFQQPFHKACIVSSITIHMIRREWVQYKCGTNICTDNRDVTIERIHNRNKEQVAGGHYERRATFQIPKDAMHSLALADNHLIWLIRVNLQVQDFMPLSETYAIQVTPEVHTL